MPSMAYIRRRSLPAARLRLQPRPAASNSASVALRKRSGGWSRAIRAGLPEAWWAD